MDEWLDYAIETGGKSAVKWSQKIPYKLVSAEGLDKMMVEKKEMCLLIQDQKTNLETHQKITGKISVKYRERLMFPLPELHTLHNCLLQKTKQSYFTDFNNQDDIYVAAEELIKQGYTNVSVLRSGIWNLRWSSHNIKGKEGLNKWVVNVPEQNL